MIGQEKLFDHLKQLWKENAFPRMIIIQGARSSGKRLLALRFASMLGQSYIPEALKVDNIRAIIEDAQTLRLPKAYILPDADSMTQQAQNALLKFAEEPSQGAYIIMTIESAESILPTIQSRSQVFKMEPYSRAELEEFTDNEALLDRLETPGQIEGALKTDWENLIKTAQMIVENIGKVNVANTFKIMQRFDMENAELLIQFMEYELIKLAGKETKRAVPMIMTIQKYKQLMRNKSINKSNAMEMMFIHLREAGK